MPPLPQNTPTAPPDGQSLGNIAQGMSNALPISYNPIHQQVAAQPAAPVAQPAAQAQPITQPASTPTPSGLDPQLVNLAKAIRQTETGGSADPFNAIGKSGEFGAYQFMPSTWDATAPKFGVNVPLSQATPEQQNQVAYEQLAQWKTQHPDWNVGNFASAWNAGPGAPDAYLNGNSGTNSKGVAYDTPAYASKVANAYQTFKAQTIGGTDAPIDSTTGTTQPQAAPSIGGFAGNALQSGANFLGNIGNAVLHPIQTVEGLGSAAVGGLQELGGQQNSNTAAFDNLASYFKNRYGSLQDLAHTAYTDPVGLAADLSTVLGAGGGALGLAGKASDIADAGNVASKAARLGADFVVDSSGNVVPAVRSAAGVASDALGGAASSLGKASMLTNPLSPVIAGAGALIGDGATISSRLGSAMTGISGTTLEDLYSHPENYTPEAVASITRTTVGRQVEAGLQDRISALEDTSKSYAPVLAQGTAIPVSKNFLEEQLRTVGKLDVKDGQIIPTTVSKLSSSDLPKLQDILDTYKPAFQKGELTPEELITLRQKLDSAAYGDNGIKNSKVAGVAAQIRGNLNDAYRQHVPGLENLDNSFSSQLTDLKELRKGFIDKEGNLTQSAINKIANAGNKDLELQRLEQIVPGITRKIEVMRGIEDINKAVAGHGGFVGKLIEGGALATGLTTGNMHLVAGSLATAFITSPNIAVPVLRAIGANKALVSNVVARMSRFATYGAVSNAVGSPAEPVQPAQTVPDTTTPQTDSQTAPVSPSSQGTGQSATQDLPASLAS